MGSRKINKRKYFFSLTDGPNIISDSYGMELLTDAHARNHALSDGLEIVRNLNPIVLVTDEAGKHVYATAFAQAHKTANAPQYLDSHNDGWRMREAMFVQTEMLNHVGGWDLNLQTRLLQWSEGTFHIFDLIQRVPPSYRASLTFFSESSRQQLNKAISAAIRRNEIFDLELKLTSANNVAKWVRMHGQSERVAGVAVRVYGSIADITASMMARQNALRLANQDALTGLANRAMFLKQLSESSDRAKHGAS